jgi:hypothetical protein
MYTILMYSYLTNTNTIHNNEIDESLDTKLEKLCNERKTLVESYNSDRGYHKFYYNIMDFCINFGSIIFCLKLGENTFKFVENRNSLEYVISVYSKIYDSVKIDLSKSIIILNKTDKEKERLDLYNMIKTHPLITNPIELYFINPNKELYNLIPKVSNYNMIDEDLYNRLPEINKLLKSIEETSQIMKTSVDKYNNFVCDNKKFSYEFKSPEIISKNEFNYTRKNELRLPIMPEIISDNSIGLCELANDEHNNDIIGFDNYIDYTYIMDTSIYYVVYSKYNESLYLLDCADQNLENKLPEFMIIKKLEKQEYDCLKQYYIKDIETFDGSNDIEQIKKYIDECLANIKEVSKNHAIENYIKSKYELTSDLNDRIKFSAVHKVILEKYPTLTTNELAKRLVALNLNKKRYSDGIYWFGMKLI